MQCPIMSYQNTGRATMNCRYDECAWFCPDSKMCAIKKIAIKDELIMPIMKAPVDMNGAAPALLQYGS